MKGFFKHIPTFILCSIGLMLAGCSSETVAANGAGAETESKATSTVTPEAASEITSGNSNASATGSSVVVYFSWSGNTKQMAEWIADESGSDIYQVIPKEAYGTDFDSCADRAKNELDNRIRPELDNLMDAQTMSQYDTVYVGFPIWWYDLPMAMTAFLESYDLSDKTIIPFFSHNGSSSGASALTTLTKICVDAKVLGDNALTISGDSVERSETKIREWVNQINQ